MSKPWAVRVPLASLAVVGKLRLCEDVAAMSTKNELWLRGPACSDELEFQLRQLAGDRFEWLRDGQLVPNGARVPLGYLPDGDWMPLSEWLRVDLAPASFAGTVTQRVSITTVRSDRVQQSNVLLAQKHALLRYAETAPSIRLKHLKFALSNDGHVVVWGSPLPPIPASFYCESQGLAVECGWTWSPAVDVDVLREVYRVKANDLLLLHGGGGWDRIESDEFAGLSRAAVRDSLREDRDA